MRPPNYDVLRQAQEQALEAREAILKPEASAQLDSAQEEPTRPTRHPATSARYDDGGNLDLQAVAVETARAAKQREDAAAQAKEQETGKGR